MVRMMYASLERKLSTVLFIDLVSEDEGDRGEAEQQICLMISVELSLKKNFCITVSL